MLAVMQYNFPVFSSILLLVAGILIGYALWLPFRQDSESILRQLDGLADQNDDLEDALKDQRNAYVQLERRHAKQQDEWVYLRTWHERLETALKEQGMATGSIEQSLTALHDLKERAMQELDIERKRRTDVEDQLLESKGSVEQLRLTQEDHRSLQSKYDGLVADFTSIKQQHAQLLGESDSLKRAADEATSQLTANLAIAESAAGDSVELESLRRALEEQRLRNDELQQDRTEILTKLQNEREQRTDVEELLQAKEAELSKQIAEAEQSAQTRMMTLEQTLDEAAGDFQKLVGERDMAVARLDQAHHRIKRLESDVESHRRAFDTVERHRSELVGSSQRDLELRQSQEQEAARIKQDVGRLQAEAALVPTLKQQNVSLDRQCKSLQESFQETQRNLSHLQTERDEAAELLAEERVQRSEISAEIEQRLDEVSDLREQREEVLCGLREEQTLRREAERALDEQTRRLAQVGREVGDLDELRDEIQTLRGQLQTARSRYDETGDQQRSARHMIESAKETINSLQSQLASSQQSIQTVKINSQGLQERYDERIEQLTMEKKQARASVELAEKKMAELQGQMDDLRSTVAELRREREDVLTRLRRQTVMLESHMAQGKANDEASDRVAEHFLSIGPARRDARRGVVYVRRPSEVDDLKKISGIAAVLETKLNQFGVYTYRQIMYWDETAIEEFSNLLTFRDRIERDDWLGQARDLHEQKYSRAA